MELRIQSHNEVMGTAHSGDKDLYDLSSKRGSIKRVVSTFTKLQ
jgi:hypothetical protein